MPTRSDRSSRLLPKLALLVLGLALPLLALDVAIRTLGWFPGHRAALRAAERRAEARQAADALHVQLHPYLAWSHRPGVRTDLRPDSTKFFPDGVPSEWALKNRRTNLLGFHSHIYDYRQVSSERYVVGVFGGSVAAYVVTLGGEAFVDRLEQRFPSLRGQVVLLNFAAGGYKQPQQLIALASALLLGIPLDVVVNLDGFNEVVFGRLSADRGGHPMQPSPRHYGKLLQRLSAPSEDFLLSSAEIVRSRRSERRLLQRFQAWPPLRHSALATTIAGGLIRRQERRTRELELAAAGLESELSGSASPSATLPDPCTQRPNGCQELIADLWQRSSDLMGALARSAGAEYLHALQPNQYAPGAKSLGPRELTVADPESLYARAVLKGYPVLRRRGRELHSEGKPFHDLTGFFRSHGDGVYIDRCCHYSVDGNRALAVALADLLEGPGDAAVADEPATADRLPGGTAEPPDASR